MGLTSITEKTVHAEDRWRHNWILNDVAIRPGDTEHATRYVERNAPDLLGMLFGGAK